MTFQEEVKALSDISTKLLQHLEPEPVYVERYIEEECARLQEEGWFEQEGIDLGLEPLSGINTR